MKPRNHCKKSKSGVFRVCGCDFESVSSSAVLGLNCLLLWPVVLRCNLERESGDFRERKGGSF